MRPDPDRLDEASRPEGRIMTGRIPMDLARLRRGYLAGEFTPLQVIEQAVAAAAADRHHAWIHLVDADELRATARALEAQDPARLPLYGIPFAVKDNIDLAGAPTTAGCPDFAYRPAESAFVVQRLVAAGAIPLGKTNLDQFATGLNGTRSPYGECRNAFDERFVSGGSSSGSAVAVALGQASFALGTDTAGSGRVPAAFNHLVGLKPSLGLVSTRGVVPACRSLDAVSIFALTAQDAHRVFAAALGSAPDDPWGRATEPHGFDFGRAARWRVGVPRPAQREFFGDEANASLFEAAIERMRALGGECVEIDLGPFLEVARLLYEGPWVAERYEAIRAFVDARPDALLPVTREITLGGKRPLAADAFAAQYRLRALKRTCDAIWSRIDCLLVPTAGTLPTREAMRAAPIVRNSELGHYTNFMNLLDCAAVAVPAGFRPDGLPFGVTFAASAHQDVPLLHLAQRWQEAGPDSESVLGATGWPPATREDVAPAVPTGQVRVAVCGAHLEGQPLNAQLVMRGARLVERTRTAPCYRLHALAGGPPRRPGLERVREGGAAIEVEVWEMPAREFGSFVAGIPAPLGIGTTRLADGSAVPGFVCEAAGLEGAEDITAFGGWRAWLAGR
jgi:allophanate hydrolase